MSFETFAFDVDGVSRRLQVYTVHLDDDRQTNVHIGLPIRTAINSACVIFHVPDDAAQPMYLTWEQCTGYEARCTVPDRSGAALGNSVADLPDSPGGGGLELLRAALRFVFDRYPSHPMVLFMA